MTLPAAESYRERVGAALAGGSRFAGLHATADGSRPRAARRSGWVDPPGDRASEDGVVPSIVDLAPAAGWDEREAHDLHGIRFAGHEPLRPLVNHDPALERGCRSAVTTSTSSPSGRSTPGSSSRGTFASSSSAIACSTSTPNSSTSTAASSAPPKGRRWTRTRLRRARLRRLRRRERRRVRARLRAGARPGHRRARPRPDGPARARTGLEPPQRHRCDLRRRPACRRQQQLRGAHRAGPPPERRADRPPLPVRGVRVGGSELALDDAQVGAGAGRARRDHAPRRAAGANCSSTPPSRTVSPTSASSPPPTPTSARSALPPGPRARRGRRRQQHTPRLRGLRPAVPERAGRRRPSAARAARARTLADLRAPRRAARRPAGPRSPRAAPRGTAASGASRARAGRPVRRRRRGDRIDRLRLRTGSYANWPVVATPSRQPAPRLPAHQQELRALLRLRGPLMLTLLRDLRRLRTTVGLPAPAAAAASLSATSTPAPATAASTNSPAREPVLRPAALRPRHRRLPRHADLLLVTGAVTTRMREPLLIAYAAMPEPRRVAALGDCALGCNVLGSARRPRRPGRRRNARRPPHPRLPTHTRRHR